MSEIKAGPVIDPTGGNAFPGPKQMVLVPPECTHAKQMQIFDNGMSLRDWFAGMATDETVRMAAQEFMALHGGRTSCSNAEARYFYADAMLQARQGE